MVAFLVELDRLGEIDDGAIHARAGEPLAPHSGEDITEFSFATTNQWRKKCELRPLAQGEDLLYDLAGGLRRVGTAAPVTVWFTDIGVVQPKEFVNFSRDLV